jgi:hypothetical protein
MEAEVSSVEARSDLGVDAREVSTSTEGLTYTWTQFEGCYSTGISLQNSGTANVQKPQFVKVIYSQP